jgi:hypothetical protein
MGKVALGIFLTFFGFHVYAEDLVLKCVGVRQYPYWGAVEKISVEDVEKMESSLIVDPENKLVHFGEYTEKYTELGTKIYWTLLTEWGSGGKRREKSSLDRVTGENGSVIEVKEKDEEEWRETVTWWHACEKAQQLF